MVIMSFRRPPFLIDFRSPDDDDDDDVLIETRNRRCVHVSSLYNELSAELFVNSIFNASIIIHGNTKYSYLRSTVVVSY